MTENSVPQFQSGDLVIIKEGFNNWYKAQHGDDTLFLEEGHFAVVRTVSEAELALEQPQARGVAPIEWVQPTNMRVIPKSAEARWRRE